MNWKLLVIILMALGHAYRMVLHFVSRRSAKNPTPANVADVYDAETYQRWKKYRLYKRYATRKDWFNSSSQHVC